MVEPISLSVATVGVAVTGAQLAIQGYEARRNKKNRKQEVIAAAAAQYPTQPVASSQSAVNPYTYGSGQFNALPNGFHMNGVNDGSQGWATITTSETVFIENGRPVTKDSKLELYQSTQYPQTQSSTLPSNMSQTNQIPHTLPLDSKPLMLSSPPLNSKPSMEYFPASDSKPPMQYTMPATADSKPPMLPLHCSISQDFVPGQGQAPWQQNIPPPPYQEYANASAPRIRKRDRWVHFK